MFLFFIAHCIFSYINVNNVEKMFCPNDIADCICVGIHFSYVIVFSHFFDRFFFSVCGCFLFFILFCFLLAFVLFLLVECVHRPKLLFPYKLASVSAPECADQIISKYTHARFAFHTINTMDLRDICQRRNEDRSIDSKRGRRSM